MSCANALLIYAELPDNFAATTPSLYYKRKLEVQSLPGARPELSGFALVGCLAEL